MHKQMIFAVAVTVSCLGFVFAHEHPTPQPRSSELEQVKKLAGTWTGTMVAPDGKSTPLTTVYRVTSGGSAVEERLTMGSMEEMVDMYADEGGKVSMTHYCAMGNHPHMLLKSSAP